VLVIAVFPGVPYKNSCALYALFKFSAAAIALLQLLPQLYGILHASL
jgi:hypothetical protein